MRALQWGLRSRGFCFDWLHGNIDYLFDYFKVNSSDSSFFLFHIEHIRQSIHHFIILIVLILVRTQLPIVMQKFMVYQKILMIKWRRNLHGRNRVPN